MSFYLLPLEVGIRGGIEDFVRQSTDLYEPFHALRYFAR